jgi:hypothetical protein
MEICWTDPCARAQALREARWKLIAGGQPTSVEYSSNETTRKVTYSAANLPTLDNEIARAEAECAAQTGTPAPAASRRYAMTAGSRGSGLRIIQP